MLRLQQEDLTKEWRKVKMRVNMKMIAKNLIEICERMKEVMVTVKREMLVVTLKIV